MAKFIDSISKWLVYICTTIFCIVISVLLFLGLWIPLVICCVFGLISGVIRLISKTSIKLEEDDDYDDDDDSDSEEDSDSDSDGESDSNSEGESDSNDEEDTNSNDEGDTNSNDEGDSEEDETEKCVKIVEESCPKYWEPYGFEGEDDCLYKLKGTSCGVYDSSGSEQAYDTTGLEDDYNKEELPPKLPKDGDNKRLKPKPVGSSKDLEDFDFDF